MWPLLAPDWGVLPRCTERHGQYIAAKRSRNGPKTAPSVLHHGHTFYSRESHGFTALSIPTVYQCKLVLASYTSVRFAFCLVMCEYLTVWLGGYCDGDALVAMVSSRSNSMSQTRGIMRSGAWRAWRSSKTVHLSARWPRHHPLASRNMQLQLRSPFRFTYYSTQRARRDTPVHVCICNFVYRNVLYEGVHY